MMVPMSQKDQRYQGDLIVENVSAVKRKKTAGAAQTAGIRNMQGWLNCYFLSLLATCYAR